MKAPKGANSEQMGTRSANLTTDAEVKTVPETSKYSQASCDTSVMMSSRQKKPTTVLMAIRTTLVGVATFSLTRKSSVRMEKAQMSTPEPANEDSRPRA